MLPIDAGKNLLKRLHNGDRLHAKISSTEDSVHPTTQHRVKVEENGVGGELTTAQKPLSTCDELLDYMRQVNTGGLSFAKMREMNKCYVDKTGLIKDVLDKDDVGVYLFTRPRRFGKTTNLSMLDAFFNEKYKGNTWFDGLEISRYPQYERFKNAFPVIHMDFGIADADSYEEFLTGVRKALATAFRPHRYLLEWPGLNQTMKDLFRLFDSDATPMSPDMLKFSVYNLCQALVDYQGKPPIILFDEYDRAVSNAFGSEFHKDVLSFLQKFMNASIKGNANKGMVYITGVLQVAKAGMFSGFNNLKVQNIFSKHSDERFGFTESEVKQVLEEYGRSEKFDEIREWYDGYRFGDAEIYNPFSVMNYVSEGFEPDEYWANSAENVVIRYLLEDLSDNDYAKVLSLVTGGTAVAELDAEVTYSTIAKSGTPLFSLMAMSGYFKAVPLGDKKYEISIPNKEVQSIVDKMMRSVYPISDSSFNEFCRAILDGDADAIVGILQDIMKDASYMHLDEYTYQAVVMTLLTGLRNIYSMKVEPESGNGRADIVLVSKVEGRQNVIIELKRSPDEGSLDSDLDDAMAQIHRRRYYLGMPGKISLLGISFWIKIPRARFEHIDNGPRGTALLRGTE